MSATGAWAHPMPNTVILVSLDDAGLTLDIAVPMPELLLALPSSFAKDAELLGGPQQPLLASYFRTHLAILSSDGTAQRFAIESFDLSSAADDGVGRYQELRLRVRVPGTQTFNPRNFTLAYDAVIHQVPNHYALVQVSQDFRTGLLPSERATELGVIRLDFARNKTAPLPIAVAPGSLWRGLRSTVVLGFHHVAAGLDHVLFLATLLVVAPLRIVNRRWSLFQGWGYALRRFLAISVAFTLGHSVALLVGAYAIVAVPRDMVEVLIAASIVVTAVHAIRPLFAGREWLVAAGFGAIHGLAFSEALVGLNLSPHQKGLAVLGFNVGVEGAQLLVMTLALPLMWFSKWHGFHVIRNVAMLCAAVVAGLWVFERAGVTDRGTTAPTALAIDGRSE